ncbi:heterokaryon incompatibility protein-domain-containing protein [Sordaria brevicollis]|uniref:Heterokaryon incompatibility protein-domain-containing protein n=1 Tax=Sordaria brevicollis TaxID=83679 RepID=A0AAE0PLL8_SORBR|nr:heterokaryon incompatibility protein-domain-containing protein [Sordaria brevicollis]
MICSVCQATLQAAINRHFRVAKNQDERYFVPATPDEEPDKEYIEDHHRDFKGFDDSVLKDCHICSFIWRVLKEASYILSSIEALWSEIETGKLSNTYQNGATQLLMNYRKCKEYECFTLNFRVINKPETIDRGPVFLGKEFLYPWSFVLEARQGFMPPPMHETSTWSLEAQSMSVDWVNDCVTSHKQCRPPESDSTWFPTRVLDIGASDEGIQLDSLPRLFQDVISVARLLEVRYLWIDSLCIIQDKDDKTDWGREASLMEEVYSNSYCNISAEDAKSCSESLFNVRDPQSVNLETTSLEIVSEESNVVVPVHFYVYNSEFWMDQVTDALANNHGWVLQEPILAPRVLHFGKPWSTASFCTSGLPVVKFLWKWIVENYSNCDLSQPGDKLVAISGIAKRFQSLLQDTYVAGMWRTNLETQVLWIKATYSTGTRPDVYRAPTWFWASLDGMVWVSEWPQDGCQMEVEDVYLSYATSDKTGGVTDGWLRLRGVLLGTKLVKSDVHELAFDFYLEGDEMAARLTLRMGVSPRVNFDVLGDIAEYEGVDDRIYSMIGHIGNATRWPALLLFGVVDERRGVFERIGLVEIGNEEQEEQIRSLAQKPGNPALPCAAFKDGKHTIIVK